MDPPELTSEPPRSRFVAAFNSIGLINVRAFVVVTNRSQPSTLGM